MSNKKQVPETLNEDQIKFWLANTSLTRDQLLEWYKSFHDYSKNNPSLDKDNFTKFFNKLHPKKDAESFYSLIFTAFDKDGSGTIEFQEFILAFNIIGNGEIETRLGWMFDVYDQNKDKSIDRKEIELIVRAILKMNKKELTGDQSLDTKIDELFEKLDDNENQKISKDEFVRNCADNMFLREILAPKF